jgi:hypothetical protein
MIKTNKILALGFGLVSMLFINSCVEDDDFTTPDLTIAPVDVSTLGGFTNFTNIIERYNDAVSNGDQVGVFSVENDAPLYTVGYVVSDDGSGNFFEEIIIQNSPDGSNPESDIRRGLKVEINSRDLGGIYNFGRKVYIKLNGLAIAEENGVYVLGKSEGSSLVQLEESEFSKYIIRDPETVAISPKMVAIGDLTDVDENTYVGFTNMQFNRNQVMLDYAGQSTDEFDGFRTLENCDTNATITLQTSTFSDFKSQLLPQGKGAIEGVFTRDFGDDFNVLVVNTTTNIDFTDPNRCDPIELDCGTIATVGTNNLFEDDFETQSNGALITGNGWTNYIQSGTEGWEAYSSGGTNSSLGRSARMQSFNSGDASSVAWLITPSIDLDTNTNVSINFKTSNSFSDGSEMELLFSTDWDGTPANIETATWGIVPAAYIVQDGDFFGDWKDSGNALLSCDSVSGTMYIAFKYTGSGQSDFDGTYELDEISIDAN